MKLFLVVLTSIVVNACSKPVLAEDSQTRAGKPTESLTLTCKGHIQPSGPEGETKTATLAKSSEASRMPTLVVSL